MNHVWVDQCVKKRPFETERAALERAETMNRRRKSSEINRFELRAYRCHVDDRHYHVGRIYFEKAAS